MSDSLHPVAGDAIPFNPFDAPTIGRAVSLWGKLSMAQFFGWLLYLTGQIQRNTYLLLKEQRRMALNDSNLAQAVTDLTTAYSNSTAAIAAEISDLRSAVQPDTDPAITTAVSNIEGIVTQMQQATTAVQAAIQTPAPASSATADPTPGSSSGSSTGSSSSASSTDQTGDSSSAAASGSVSGATGSDPSSSPASTTEANVPAAAATS